MERAQPTQCLHSAALPAREVWRRPLPGLAGDRLARLVLRSFLWVFRGFLLEVRGIEQIAPERDPFILTLNHNTDLEALLVPMLFIHQRGGKLLHFLSDWNFQLIPGVAYLLRRSEVITLVQKPARPRFLNRFKSRFEHPLPALERAHLKLREGASIGVYPEGTLNRNPRRLLRGHVGAARLSLVSGTPVVPCGIAFPEWTSAGPLPHFARMTVSLGDPLRPPPCPAEPSADQVRHWHAVIMQAIARLSQKSWQPRSPRRNA